MIRLLAVLLALGTQAQAQDAGQAARDAAQMLSDAATRLDRAEGARNRVKALTQTVQAYEAGLAAMRDGLRRASLRELQVQTDLNARDDEIAQLLGVLLGIARTGAPESVLHPDGPLGTARAGMMLADVTPGLAARAAVLRRDLEEVSNLRALQQDAVDRLRDGLTGLQLARTELSMAMANRTNLPRRFTADPERTSDLIAATETLDAFASGLSGIAENEAPGSLPSMTDRKGSLPMPVQGNILRRAGEADAAGVARPGIVVATRPRALVSTPSSATIRYTGPLLDYGLVTILEPQADLLIVLAGLDVAYGEAGQVLPSGSPVGLMGGDDTPVSPNGEGAGVDRPETLYIEVRQGGTPVDPLDWFQTDKG